MRIDYIYAAELRLEVTKMYTGQFGFQDVMGKIVPCGGIPGDDNGTPG
ncbi:MAG: hypothetical protein HXS46_08590 [Theionarchaea archaeon]|nr:hypothetical protein [Theionarchaea archaeon]